MRSGSGESMYFRKNKDWYYCDENGEYAIKDDAPELAKMSFKAYKLDVPEKTWTYEDETLSESELAVIKEKLSFNGIDTQSLDDRMIYLIKVAREKCFFIYDREMENNYFECVSFFVKMPRRFVVRFGLAEFTDEGCSFMQPIIEWGCDNGNITISDTFSEISNEENEFFSKAYFDFAIDDENEKVYIDYYFGKRYAKGMCFDYEYSDEEDDYQKAWLFDEKVLWVS